MIAAVPLFVGGLCCGLAVANWIEGYDGALLVASAAFTQTTVGVMLLRQRLRRVLREAR